MMKWILIVTYLNSTGFHAEIAMKRFATLEDCITSVMVIHPSFNKSSIFCAQLTDTTLVMPDGSTRELPLH